MTSLCVGIDPGGSGSIVVVGDDDVTGKVFIHSTYRLKTDELGTPLNRWCQDFWLNHRNKTRLDTVPVFLEKVGARPGQGVCSMFQFGWNACAPYQAGCLIAEPQFVTPQKWQKMFGLVFPKSLGLTKTEKKNKHKQYVTDTFGFDLVHAEVDAFLIAVYGAVTSGTLKI